MARQCYLILDSDLHIMEPDDLSARYLDEPYRSTNPPRFLGAQAGGSAASGLDDRAVPEPAVIGRASVARSCGTTAPASTQSRHRRQLIELCGSHPDS